MSNLSPTRRAELTAKFGLDQRDNWHNTAHPGVEQIAAAQAQSHHYAADPDATLMTADPAALERVGQRFTPWNRRPQEVQDKLLDLSRWAYALLDDPAEYIDKGLSYLHSNLPGRRPMPLRDQPYSEAELRAEAINRGDNIAQRREAVVTAERDWPLYLRAAISGPGQVVIIHLVLGGGPVVERRSDDRLPNGESFRPTFVEWPVPHGYTAFRVARVIWDVNYAGSNDSECRWCYLSHMPLRLMLVSTQGTLHVIPTCDACADEIGPGPDYYDPNNGEEARRGFPADQYR